MGCPKQEMQDVEQNSGHGLWVPFQWSTVESCWSTTYSTSVGTLNQGKTLVYQQTATPGQVPDQISVCYQPRNKWNYTVLYLKISRCGHDYQSPRSMSRSTSSSAPRNLFIAPLPPQSQELGCCDAIPQCADCGSHTEIESKGIQKNHADASCLEVCNVESDSLNQDVLMQWNLFWNRRKCWKVKLFKCQ